MGVFPSENQKMQQENQRLRRELAEAEAQRQLLFEFQVDVRRWNPQHCGEKCWQELDAVTPPCGLCRAWREFKRKSDARSVV